MTDRLHVGLIGAGRIGRLHAEHLVHHLPRARLVGVADVVEAAARECAERLDVPRAVADYQRLLDDPDVQAVVICSATDTHARIIEQAAMAGKHVFCEKPIALTLASIDQALCAVERGGVKLQLGFNRRFDPTYSRARGAIANGEVGEPWLLHLISRDPEPPPLDYLPQSGGLFLDQMIHDFDMARFLIGSEIEQVYAVGAVRVDEAIGQAGDVDTAVATLQFANGVIGTIDNSRKAAFGYDQRVEVLGSAGLVQTDNIYPNAALIGDARGMRRDVPLNFFMQRYLDSYRIEMAAFVDAVLDDGPVPVGGQDGRIAVVIGLAALRSHQEHRPVRVAEIG